jgi:hypothetical protein
MHMLYLLNFIIKRCTLVAVLTRLVIKQSRNVGSIPSKDKRFFVVSKAFRHPRDPTDPLFKGYRGVNRSEHEADRHLRLVLISRIPELFHVISSHYAKLGTDRALLKPDSAWSTFYCVPEGSNVIGIHR